MPRTVDYAKILQDLNNNITTLTELDLSRQSLYSDEVEALANALERNTSLSSLNLWGNCIGTDAAIMALAKALEKNMSLTSLNLRNSHLGTPTYVMAALLIQSDLTKIYGKDGIIAVENALERNIKLKEKTPHCSFFSLPITVPSRLSPPSQELKDKAQPINISTNKPGCT